MRLTILAHKARTVHGEDHRQVLDRAVMDHVVIRTLQERGVDRDYRLDAARREASRERDRMPLRNADIEGAHRMRLRDDTDAGAARHCRGDGHDVGLLLHQVGKALAEHCGVAGVRRRSLELLASRGIVTGRQRMPLFRVLAGRESLPLLRDHVYEARRLQVAHGGQCVHQRIDVVAIDRTEVAEAKFLEQHAGREERLHAFLPLAHQRTDGARHAVDQVADRAAHTIVERIALHADEILVHRTDVRRNGHLVVVQDDDDVTVRAAGVVQPFVCEPA